MKPSIFIATPNLGEIATGNVLNLLAWFTSGRYRLKWYAPQNIRPWDRARNLCHKVFLESDMDYLFFLDEHTVPPAGVLDRLLADDRDMVAATVQVLKTDGGKPVLIPIAMRWDKEACGYKPYWGHGVEPVDVATCACTLIKRRVMEAVPPPAFQFVTDDKWGTSGLSEDFFFSEQVRRAGFQPYIDYRILCGHTAVTDLRVVNDLLLSVGAGGGEDG